MLNMPATRSASDWAGCEESDPVEGEGTVELLDDAAIEIEFGYRNGNEVQAEPQISSTGLRRL
jgi:hypothetical protein